MFGNFFCYGGEFKVEGKKGVKLGSMVRINGLFHLPINGVYWGYNSLTNHLLTSWDIQEGITYFDLRRSLYMGHQITNFEGIKQCKDLVILRVLPSNGALFGVVM